MEFDHKRIEAMGALFRRDLTMVAEAISLVLAVGSVERAAEVMRVPPEKLREWLGRDGEDD